MTRDVDIAVPRVLPEGGGLLVLHAHFRRHRFVPHTHETYSIGLILEGANVFDRGRLRFAAPAGSISLINPGEVHTGDATLAGGWTYWSLYPSVELMRDIALSLAGRPVTQPAFASPVLGERGAVEGLRRYFRAVADDAPRLMRECLLQEAFSQLLCHHGGLRTERFRACKSPRLVTHVQEVIATRFAEPLGLADLAAVAGVSSFHLVRLFKATTGLPVHAYLVQRRLARAKELLMQGVRAAEVAMTVGFADQAHLTRWMKRTLGITPGQLAAASRTFKTV